MKTRLITTVTHTLKDQFGLLCLVGFISLASTKSHSQEIFSTKVHEIQIEIAEENWFDTLQNFYNYALNGAENRYLPIEITIDGTTLDSVGFRFKGKYSNYGFPGKKKPFRLDFNEFVQGQDFQGLKKLNLNNLAGDPSFLREHMAYDLLRYMGIPAPRTSFCQLFINHEYWGCYELVEEPDKRFLDENFGQHDGNLFEAIKSTELSWNGINPENYPELELKTDSTSNSWENILSWIDLVNNNHSYDFNQQLQHRFDVEQYMRILATDVLINNHDSYASNRRNFFLYDNPKTDQIHWIPWDYNLSFWAYSPAILPYIDSNLHQPLVQRFAEHAYLIEHYLKTTCSLLDNEYLNYPFRERALQMQNLIREAVLTDTLKFYTNQAFEANIDQMVIVNMLRNNVPTDVYLPGIAWLFQKRKNDLRKEIFVAGCDCDNIAASNEFHGELFPNPAQTQLTIYLEENVESYKYAPLVQLIDLNGNILWSEYTYPQIGNYQFDVSNFQEGLYYARIVSEDQTFIKKWVKIN